MAFVSGTSLEKTSRLQDIVITDELFRRMPSDDQWAAGAASLHALADGLLGSPQELLVVLMEQALKVCKAHTAGLSVLYRKENGQQCFRWDAMAGTLKEHVGGETSRNFSPCGVTLDAGVPQLFKYPGRYFHYLLEVDPQIVEGLVVPVFVDGVPGELSG